MAKHVILTLKYDMGDYSEREEVGLRISTNPKDYEESFYQGDIFTCDMEIVGVEIEERSSKQIATQAE